MAILSSFKFPAGVGMDYAGNTAPLGWLLCHGQAVSRVTYKPLFDAIGTLYGVGDGVNTFNLPDVRGRVRFAKDNMGGTAANRITTGGSGLNGLTLGGVGGAESVTLTASQMPVHTHIQEAHLHAIQGGTTSGTSGVNGSASAGGSVSENTTSVTAINQENGSSEAHSNIPPAIIFNYIISTGA